METPCDQLATCHLLRLPAELRNYIYELTFASDTEPETTSLLAPAPPNWTLLQTCHEIHEETAPLHTKIDREHWTATHFTVRADELEGVLSLLESGNTHKIKLLQSSEIEVCGKGGPDGSRLVPVNDVWSYYCGSKTMNNSRSVATMFIGAQEITNMESYKSLRLVRPGDCWGFVRLDELSDEEVEELRKLAQRTHLTKHEIEGALRYFVVPGPGRRFSFFQHEW